MNNLLPARYIRSFYLPEFCFSTVLIPHLNILNKVLSQASPFCKTQSWASIQTILRPSLASLRIRPATAQHHLPLAKPVTARETPDPTPYQRTYSAFVQAKDRQNVYNSATTLQRLPDLSQRLQNHRVLASEQQGSEGRADMQACYSIQQEGLGVRHDLRHGNLQI